jgi:hypothetical protein
LKKASNKNSPKQIITKYISDSPKINTYKGNDGRCLESIPEDNATTRATTGKRKRKANRNVNKNYWLKSPTAETLPSVHHLKNLQCLEVMP